MKDSDFKILNHLCLGYSIYSKGKRIAKNYTPDFVLNKNDEYIILEHETTPNRKTIVANIFKASLFLQDNKSGYLIIVLTPKKGSSIKSYVNHCEEYFNWLKNRTNLKGIYFIHMDAYKIDIDLNEIFSNQFQNKSLTLT